MVNEMCGVAIKSLSKYVAMLHKIIIIITTYLLNTI